MVPNMTVEIDKPSIVSLESFNKSISANLEALQVYIISLIPCLDSILNVMFMLAWATSAPSLTIIFNKMWIVLWLLLVT